LSTILPDADSRITVDGEVVELPEHLIYRGMMISDVPNMAFTVGDTNASWTLETRPLMNFSSGYIQRAVGDMPKEGTRSPWKMYQNFLRDKAHLTRGAIDDGVMQFE
jgi:cation diffusion facilitator CzcD-associated flavoprotein CzcO